MKRIDLTKPRQGADGIERSWKDIEREFLSMFSVQIENELKEKNVSGYNVEIRNFHSDLLSKLDEILIGKPDTLEIWRNRWDNLLKKLTAGLDDIESERMDGEISSYKGELMSAFGYEKNRGAMLNRIAVMINVKTCLYCNQQYTVVVGRKPRKDGGISLSGSRAFLQFDHFFEKSDYPFLSMSLYNLIPSCGVCNQKKSKTPYPLSIHPYVCDYSSKLTFRIKDQNALTNLNFMKFDFMEVEIDTKDNNDLAKLMQDLEMDRRYWRHLDIVKELETAKLLQPYYDKLIDGSFGKDMGEAIRNMDKTVVKRHLYGFYTDSEEINNRPLTKFCQDIYKQLSPEIPSKK